MKYELKSGLASYEGEPIGEKNFCYPAKRKDLECALKEALMELAELEDWRDKVFKAQPNVDMDIAMANQWGSFF